MAEITQQIPGGGSVVLTSEMTPQERHNTIAKAMNAPTIETPVSPAQFHTDATITTFGQREVKAEPTSKSKRTLVNTEVPREEQQRKIAAFDAEMRTKGIQREQPVVRHSQVDETLVPEIYKHFNLRVKACSTDAQRTALRALLDKEVQEVMRGRQRGESSAAFETRMAGPQETAVSPIDGTPATPEDAAIDQASIVAARQCDKDGFANHTAITGPLLHGYQIPAGRWHVAEMVAGLRQARKLGLTQKQVTEYIEDLKK